MVLHFTKCVCLNEKKRTPNTGMSLLSPGAFVVGSGAFGHPFSADRWPESQTLIAHRETACLKGRRVNCCSSHQSPSWSSVKFFRRGQVRLVTSGGSPHPNPTNQDLRMQMTSYSSRHRREATRDCCFFFVVQVFNSACRICTEKERRAEEESVWHDVLWRKRPRNSSSVFFSYLLHRLIL
jgi:hypothetical protein